MKKTFFIGGLALSALSLVATGCSDVDEPMPGTQTANDGAIRFAAKTELSRSGAYTTNNLTAFNVYAYQSSDQTTPYMNNVEVTKSSSNIWTYSPIAYWPSSGTLDFYAYAPSTWVGTNSPLKPIAWDNNANAFSPGATDLIYAVATGLSGHTDTPNAQVVFNFRHALSKLTVNMSSSNANLKVQVSNVVIAGVNSKGSFTFPTATTTGALTADNVGSWSGQNTPSIIYLHISQAPDDLITLTTTPTNMDDTGAGLGGGKFMIPQELIWRSNGSGKDMYIAVMCSVYDATTGTKLWPNANTPAENVVSGSAFGDGLLKFPLSTSQFTAWQPGNSYIYNLIINSNEEMGTIEFGNPTVDTYVEVVTYYE